ncbi:MAG: single-stranded DNA-binding protein [Clostridiales bacterium]|nr:single-stranded DNA-binding protein [Clostridiales bacterium]
MNKIILIGNLTRDPESGSTQGGVNFTRFTIAVNRPFTNSAGERVADYFDIICWRQLAERCAKYLFKGSKVGVNGYVQRRQYEDRDGIKRTSFDVVADEVEFLTPRSTTGGSRDNIQGGGYAPEEPHPISDMQPVDNDDLPF